MLRIATIGTSPITDNLIEVLNASSEARFVGTLSRDAERAAVFTRDHGGDTPFTRLEDLAASSDVDAVYIGSPNGLHATQALELIEHGKHVLVEKPLAQNATQAELLFDEAATHGVIAMEAMRSVHDPGMDVIAAAMERIGRVRRASLRFGKYSSRYDEVLAGKRTNIFDCAMASGALMDIGIYAVEPMVALFGTPVEYGRNR